MQVLSSLNLILNGLMLVATSSFVALLFWYDRRKPIIQFLGIAVIFVILWNIGVLISQVLQLLTLQIDSHLFTRALVEIGFSGASIAIYGFVSLIAGIHTRQLRYLSMLSLVLVFVYYAFLIVIANASTGVISTTPTLNIFYFIFSVGSVWLTLRYRRKIDSFLASSGVLIFVIGQGVTFLNPQIPITELSTNISSFGVLLLSIAIIHDEMLQPLRQHVTQVEDIHQATLAISSQLALSTVLNEISSQAANWTEADAVAIFLKRQDGLELVSSYGLPEPLSKLSIPLENTIAGRSILEKRTIYVENYRRDWVGSDDLPYAQDVFGSVISVPLQYSNQVIGAILVIAGQHSHLLSQEQASDLEQIAAQAAVAIGHGRLFEAVTSARKQIETVLESTDNLIIAFDRHLSVIFINSAARRVFDLSDDGPLDREDTADLIQSVIEENSSQLAPQELLRKLLRERKLVIEIEYKNHSYLCHLSTIGVRSVDGFVAVFNEITYLKELDRMKSEMIRMASHDLKNPLMGAMLYLDLAREQSTGGEESLEVVEAQLDRMHRIIRGVLDLEHVRRGLQKKVLCDGQVIARSVWKDLKGIAAENNIQFSFFIGDEEQTGDYSDLQPGYCFMGDPGQIERALINLVENALKFTHAGGQVWLKVFEEERWVTFTVRDTGVGIPKEIQSQIFERFFRGGQRGVEHVSGSGLGLSIVRTIVEQHNGQLTVESAAGVGSTFTISFQKVK